MSERPQDTTAPAPESADNASGADAAPAPSGDGGQRYVVVTPDGLGVATDADVAPPAEGGESAASGGRTREPSNPADLVEEPAKVMRIGAMVKQLLEEVRSSPLDDKGRARLAEIHERSIAELKDGLAPELVAELDRIALPFSDDNPSDAELRIAQAQLVGWLEGLFHGIQTALVAQQMAAQAQLQHMRQLPPGITVPGETAIPQATRPGMDGPVRPDGPGPSGTGQYL